MRDWFPVAALIVVLLFVLFIAVMSDAGWGLPV